MYASKGRNSDDTLYRKQEQMSDANAMQYSPLPDGWPLGPPSARWFPLKAFPARTTYTMSTTRFHLNHSGRRSYKTEIALRRLVAALYEDLWQQEHAPWGPGRYAFAAPTRPQTKDIAWVKLKELIPTIWLKESPRETELRLTTRWGTTLTLFGLDRAERMEGGAFDGLVVDEIGNVKSTVWHQHLRPTLSDRFGWAEFIGVPEGRNHYYDLEQTALASPELWTVAGWHSEMVLDPAEIAQVRAEMDTLTFDQEYGGSFVAWRGRAYYQFDPEANCRPCAYQPLEELIFCFDFNVSPGVACVCQETAIGTVVIGEVWVPRNSNTEIVCRKLLDDYGEHPGRVVCYGDATGGAGGSAQVKGSDWDLVRATLDPVYGSRVSYRYPDHNSRVRARINATNSRIKTADGQRHLFVDPAKAPHVVKDLDGVTLVEGTSDKIHKPQGSELSHISDALGYYISLRWPISDTVLEPEGTIVTGEARAYPGEEQQNFF